MKFDRRLLAEARAVRGWLGLSIGFGVLTGFLTVAQAAALAAVIDRVFLKSATLAHVLPLLSALLIVMLMRAGLTWAGDVSAFRAAARVKTQLRQRLFDHLLQLGPAYVRGERTGELVNTAVDGIEALEAYFSQYLPQLVLAAVVPLLMLIFVFPIDLLSALILLITAPLIPFFMILIGKAADALTKRQYAELSFLSAHFLDVLQGLTTLKLLGRSRQQLDIIAQISRRFRDATLSVLRVAFLSAFALEMIATLSTAIVAVEIGLRLLYGTLQFEPAFFVLVLAPDFYLPLRLLGTRFHAGLSGVAAAARIFEVLETGNPRSEREEQEAMAQWSKIRFEKVIFAYEDERSALNGASFEINRGERVALVGATGAGKSTIANLLLRFIEPQHGAILIDGAPLNDCTPEAWRRQIAWVPQLPYLFNDTIAANLRLARPAAADADVITAARRAHADEFIRNLPAGYETVIGERGARLSGGQAQRLALARAFLKDAPLLILDEATSHLDLVTEDLIQDSIDQLLVHRTALIITHRLSTAARADRIIVLDQGQVVEQGTPAELMQKRGAYYQLVMTYPPAGRRDVDAADGVAHDHKPQPSPAVPASSVSNQGDSLITRPSSFVVFRRLLRLVAPFKWWMALSVLLGVLTIGSSVGLLSASAWIIATAALRPSVADLAVAIVGVRFFGIARGVFRYLERLVSHYVNFSLLARLRVWFYAALEPLAPARLLQARSGDLLSRIVGDIETLQNFFIRVLAPPATALVVAAIMAVFLAAFDPSIALVVLVFMVLIGAGLPLSARVAGRNSGRRVLLIRSELSTALIDGIQGCADLIALGRQADQSTRIRTLSLDYARAQTRLAEVTAAHSALGGLLTQLAMWTVLLAAIPLVRAARLTGVDLAVLALATLASFEGVLALPLAFQYLDQNLQAARRLFEIADSPPATTEPRQPATPPTGAVSLRVEHLSFRYGENEPPALQNMSFEVRPGRRIAVVGASGAGKSTLVNLLLRFWDYESGHIWLNGVEARDLETAEVRRLIAVVAQQTHLFNTSIRENLRLARSGATDAEIERAARQAQIHDFIQALPQGYDTPIGEQGLKLSGGERQRLAMARALLTEAPLVILDEATANLDPVTEQELWNAVEPLFADRAVLIITHRLTGLDRADEIIVLDGGRVIERGTHAELLQRRGPYYRLRCRQDAG
jgi:ATP-binding cassette subfamily C protein CydCD